MKTLVIRYGSLGDFVSAYDFCAARNDCDLFICRNISDFLFNLDSLDPLLLKNLMSYGLLNVYSGGILNFIRIVNEGGYSSIYLFAQSNSGMSFKFTKYILNFLAKTALSKKIKHISRFLHGGQYYWQINLNSRIREFIKSLPPGARISICYDGKEESKNLNEITLLNICNTLIGALDCPKIKIFGLKPIILNSQIKGLENLTGQTSISSLFKNTRETDLAILIDSGPLHMFSREDVPSIVFLSGRHPLLNWTPFKSTNYYIYDDELDCLGCMKTICPRGDNVCVNSPKNLKAFNELFN